MMGSGNTGLIPDCVGKKGEWLIDIYIPSSPYISYKLPDKPWVTVDGGTQWETINVPDDSPTVLDVYFDVKWDSWAGGSYIWCSPTGKAMARSKTNCKYTGKKQFLTPIGGNYFLVYPYAYPIFDRYDSNGNLISSGSEVWGGTDNVQAVYPISNDIGNNQNYSFGNNVFKSLIVTDIVRRDDLNGGGTSSSKKKLVVKDCLGNILHTSLEYTGSEDVIMSTSQYPDKPSRKLSVKPSQRMPLDGLVVSDYEDLQAGRKGIKIELANPFLPVATNRVLARVNSPYCSDKYPFAKWVCEDCESCPPETCFAIQCGNDVCCFDSSGTPIYNYSLKPGCSESGCTINP